MNDDEAHLKNLVRELQQQLSYEKEKNSFLQNKIQITVQKHNLMKNQLMNLSQISQQVLKMNEEKFHPSLPLMN